MIAYVKVRGKTLGFKGSFYRSAIKTKAADLQLRLFFLRSDLQLRPTPTIVTLTSPPLTSQPYLICCSYTQGLMLLIWVGRHQASLDRYEVV